MSCSDEHQQVKALKAEFERVQVALGVFYQETDTRSFTTADITPDLLSKMPSSALFDVRVQIGSGDFQIFCNHVELVAKMLTVPCVSNNTRWCSGFISMFPDGGTVIMDGSPCNKKECFIKIIEANPHINAAWYVLGGELDDGETVLIDEDNFAISVKVDVSSSTVWGDLDTVLSSGVRAFDTSTISTLDRPYTKKDCYIKVVELTPQCLEGWLALISSSSFVSTRQMITPSSPPKKGKNEETFNINDTIYTFKDCCVKVLEIDSNIMTWYYLGMCIWESTTSSSSSAAVEVVARIHGTPYTAMDCFLKCIQENEIPKAWCHVGYLMDATASKKSVTVQVAGKKYTQQQCFLKAIELDTRMRDSCHAWYLLGRTLFGTETITMQGKTYTDIQCYTRSLEMEPLNSGAWYSIGYMMEEGRPVVINGTSYTTRQCHLKAIQINAVCFEAWFHLGNELCKEDGQTAFISGKSYTGQQCFIKSLEINPEQSDTFFCLGKTLEITLPMSGGFGGGGGGGAPTAVVNGTSFTERQCYIKALEIDQNKTDTWFSLGYSLVDDRETAMVKGGRYTKKECYIKAVTINPQHCDAWCMIGKMMSPGETVTIGGRSFDNKASLIMALMSAPQHGDAWMSLGYLLSNGETARLFGRQYTKDQCLTMAQQCW